jgi:hypothetical protein
MPAAGNLSWCLRQWKLYLFEYDPLAADDTLGGSAEETSAENEKASNFEAFKTGSETLELSSFPPGPTC